MNSSATSATERALPRSRFQFGLRRLLALVSVVCGVLGVGYYIPAPELITDASSVISFAYLVICFGMPLFVGGLVGWLVSAHRSGWLVGSIAGFTLGQPAFLLGSIVDLNARYSNPAWLIGGCGAVLGGFVGGLLVRLEHPRV